MSRNRKRYSDLRAVFGEGWHARAARLAAFVGAGSALAEPCRVKIRVYCGACPEAVAPAA
eukprot:14717471-Alexandrium_andersonii.AAC.1